jgi:hypothetical integral membrane protein (TIGR02206 family)
VGIPIYQWNSTLIRRVLFAFFVCAWLSIVAIDFITFLNFKADSRIIIHNPIAGYDYPPHFKVMGYAWDRDSIERGDDFKIEVAVTRVSDGKMIVFPGVRSASRIKGKTILNLSGFSCEVALPGSGAAERWRVSARMTTRDGRSFGTLPREINIGLGTQSREFRFLSVEHIITLGLVLFFAVCIVLFFGKKRNAEMRPYVGLLLVSILWINEIAYHIYWSAIGAWTPSGTLMFHMCGFSLMIMPIALLTRKMRLRKYLIEGGAVQALITPDIGVHGFPEFRFFQFMIVHGIIVINALFLVTAYDIRIGFKSFIRVVILTNLCVLFSFIINPVFKSIPPFEIANYFIVSYPPAEGSIIDLLALLFGPSPKYLIGLELMGLVLFAILCLPFSSPGGIRKSIQKLFIRKVPEDGAE